jgi:hypothetical protein
VKVSTEVTGGGPREVTYALPLEANKANHAKQVSVGVRDTTSDLEVSS